MYENSNKALLDDLGLQGSRSICYMCQIKTSFDTTPCLGAETYGLKLGAE